MSLDQIADIREGAIIKRRVSSPKGAIHWADTKIRNIVDKA